MDQLTHLPELPIELGLRVPETAIWANGAPVCVLKLVGARLLRLSKSRLSKMDVLRQFTRVEKKRSHLEVMPAHHHDHKNLRHACTRPLVNYGESFAATCSRAPRGSEDWNEKYKFVLRVVPDEELSRDRTVLLTEKMMSEIMTKLPTDKLKNIKAFHSYIRTGRAAGDARSFIIRVRYVSPEVQKQPCSKTAGSPRPFPTNTADHRCKAITRAICGLMERLLHIQVLEMTAEFFVSHDFWLNDVWRIVYVHKKPQPERLEEKSGSLQSFVMNQESKDSLLQRLRLRGQDAVVRTLSVDPFKKAIDGHLKEMKERAGLTETMEQGMPDTSSNEVFQTLRPNCPYTLSALLSPGFKPSKHNPKCTSRSQR